MRRVWLTSLDTGHCVFASIEFLNVFFILCLLCFVCVSFYYISQYYWHDGSIFKSSSYFSVLDKSIILQIAGHFPGPLRIMRNEATACSQDHSLC